MLLNAKKIALENSGKYDLANIVYKSYRIKSHTISKKSIVTVGVDTEAYLNGECFLICTSSDGVFKFEEFPECFFTRKYRNTQFVVYNLKYDSGHFVQFLPRKAREYLWQYGNVGWGKYVVKIIAYKMLSISKGKNSITFWDIANFFKVSLNNASLELLYKRKKDLDPNLFHKWYVFKHLDKISDYCIQDAKLTQELAQYLIDHFEKFDIYPKKLYSTAYISAQNFRQRCFIPQIRRFYNYHKECLQFALWSYRGGKFEVTEKGIDNYYTADINSAYPYEIANLVDISLSRIVHLKKYRKNAVYGFIHCIVHISSDVYHPISIKNNGLCIYPSGSVDVYITKSEYDYLINLQIEIDIIDAYWMEVDKIVYPYREEITRLFSLKKHYKIANNFIDYYVVKTLQNSWYGKMIQLIKKGDKWHAGSYFNPFYASIITANTRIRVSKMQNSSPFTVATFQDSIISTRPLNIGKNDELGDWSETESGYGIILGSGIYQIGEKRKFRGFNKKLNLWSLCSVDKSKLTLIIRKPYSWKEVIFHGWSDNVINKFDDIERTLAVNFDQKRLWLEDWEKFSDISKRKVESTPRFFHKKLGLI